MYQLYIANKNYSSWSLRPWVLLKERNIPFEEVLVPFDTATSYARFKVFSPTGKVPCLLDGAQVVWDSLGIVEYLAERHSGIWPADPAARVWARCASAEIHSGFVALRQRCTMNCGIRVQLMEIPADLRRDLDRLDELWNEGLARFGGPFLAGEAFTAVDAFYAPVAFRAQTYHLPLSTPALEYAARLRALPSMMAWYDGALHEGWRDPEHEADASGCGKLLADLRVPPSSSGGG